jgi:hypothetical protein
MFLAILGLLPAIPNIILGVEHMFGKGRGPAKKSATLTMVSDMLNIFGQAMNQPASVADSAHMTFIGKLIDATVEFMNATGVMTHAAPSVTSEV